MKIMRLPILLALTLGGLVMASPARSAGVVAASAAPSAAAPVSIEPLSFVGTTMLEQQTAGSATTPGTAQPRPDRLLLQVNRSIPRSGGSGVLAAYIPAPASSTIAATSPGFSGFAGITQRDQELAGTGRYANTQPFVTPPDQGLCAGNGFVIDAVNLALRVYRTSGASATLTTPLNEFFQLAPYQTPTGAPFGPFLSDPRCYFDVDTGRWFATVLEIGIDPATGAFGNTSAAEIAVSQTGDPTRLWNLFTFSTTDKTGTPAHAGCPCFGDQPLIGADKFGFYYSTNEYPITGPGFNGAQVYALSKAALVAGRLPPVVHIDAGAIPTPNPPNLWYSLQPATSPAAQYNTANGGTEFFLSALDFSGTGDNRIAAWALTNTSSLDSADPDVRLSHDVIGSEHYLEPFNPSTGTAVYNATQKPGPTPLANFLNFYFKDGDHLELLASNDDRMNQVVYADGKLWSGVNTVVQVVGFPAHIGSAYFVVTPFIAGGQVMATMTRQGYVALDRVNVLFPAIGVNTAGRGVIAFSLSGPDLYPSTGYVLIDATSGAGPVHIAGAGADPQDDFTGYHYFQRQFGIPLSQVARWGDYSAAVADPDGTIWLAAEYIPDLPRLLMADWGTFIGHVTP